jgi:hypothetical protein
MFPFQTALIQNSLIRNHIKTGDMCVWCSNATPHIALIHPDVVLRHIADVMAETCSQS